VHAQIRLPEPVEVAADADACSGQSEFRMVSAKLPRPKPGTNHSRTSVQARHPADRMDELFLCRHSAMRLRPVLAAQG
jgi:hypothetical protein